MELMNISKQEAQESLAEIDKAISQTQKAVGQFFGYYLMMWGVIWAIGLLVTQFRPDLPGWSWALWPVGFAGTWILAKQSNSKFSLPGGGRIWLAWGIFDGYMLLWLILLHPSGNAGSAFLLTAVMGCFVIMGLWVSRVFLLGGLILTVLTVAGFYLLPAWFPLCQAITGGGGLFLAGLSIIKSWK